MLRIHAVGGFRVETGDDERTPAAFDRAAALLAWLALNPGLHPRSSVAARFWPDVLDESARASLRSALWSLRRLLGEDANGALVATRDRVGLDGEVWVDVAEAERLRREGRLDEALELCEGELLPGLEDEWVLDARDEHRDWTAALLEELAAAAESAGDARRAADLSRRAGALEPLSEEIHRALMRRLAAAGDRAGALAVYGDLRTRLLRTLRVGPSEETLRAAEALRAGVPANTVPARLHRLDSQLFVGRARELDRLRDLRDRSAEGGVVALIAGEAGSGKTRLAARFGVETAAAGVTVLYGCCAPEALVAYEPFADALGETALDATTVEERLALAGNRVLIVLDDLQWADRSSLALLVRLLRGDVADRLVVVGAYREDEAQEPLFATIADLRRHATVERIELDGLAVPEIAALIRGAFETSAVAAQAHQIHARTGGNPFYARELARHVAEHPRTAFGDVPEGVRDVVRARVERLSDECAPVLRAAAVLGVSFALPELEVVAVRTAVAVEHALEEAAAAGLIEEIGAGRYRFAHSLTRDAVYAGLSASRSARLHRAAAAALAARDGIEAGPHLAAIALHRCAGAVDGTGVEEGVELAERAAEWALEHDAYEQAVRLLTPALALLADADAERRRRLTRARAVAYARLTHALFDS